jgi:hypothetical protein
MPTEAAWATSRIVVFLGTASMATRPFVVLASGWVRGGNRPTPLARTSLTHQNGDGIVIGQQAGGFPPWGKKLENRCYLLIP